MSVLASSNVESVTSTLFSAACEIDLEARVEDCLRQSPYSASFRDVHCECREGIALLRGSVPTYYLKQIAQTSVALVEGVLEIVNRIEVISAPGAWQRGRMPDITAVGDS